MRGSGDGVRAAVLAFAVLACVQPAFAQKPRAKELIVRPPLDIKPLLKPEKPTRSARAKVKAVKPAEEAPKPAEAPAGPTLASASSTPVVLPPAAAKPAAVPMMPDLKPSIAAPTSEQRTIERETQPAYMRVRLTRTEEASRAELSPIISKHAAANGVPDALVHRVIMRESRYNPRAMNLGNFGLMQIKHSTARAMGYDGAAKGLLDAETNITYAVKYLAGAYRKANGNQDRAVAYYARGYYESARR